MKKIIILTLALSFTGIAEAGILNSKYEARHQAAIENAVYTQCGAGKLIEIYDIEKTITVDQGITDVEYQTELELYVNSDQNETEVLAVSVRSTYSDVYDHNSQEWGAYTVESVNCVPTF